MVPVPGGSFTVTDPADLSVKRILKVGDIWIGKTEVTWPEYDVWRLSLDHEPAERRRDPPPRLRLRFFFGVFFFRAFLCRVYTILF